MTDAERAVRRQAQAEAAVWARVAADARRAEEQQRAVRILCSVKDRPEGAQKRIENMVREFWDSLDAEERLVEGEALSRWRDICAHTGEGHDYELVEVCRSCGITGTVREWTP